VGFRKDSAASLSSHCGCSSHQPAPPHLLTPACGEHRERVIPDRKMLLNTTVWVPSPLPSCRCVCSAGGPWRRGRGGQARGGGQHPPTHMDTGRGATQRPHGEGRKGERGRGRMLWVTSARVNHAMGACGGRERREGRTAGGQPLALASAATAPPTHLIPPHRTHTPNTTGTQLNLRHGCFGSAFAFRGFRVVAAEGRKRGLREGRTGHNESDRQEGGGPTNYGACGRGVTRCRLRSLRGIRAGVLE
jgi:hypothetical protein